MSRAQLDQGSAMLAQLINASSWSHEQWLVISILVFIALASLVIVWRLFKLFRLTQQQPYQPNLRPLRRRRLHRAEENREARNEAGQYVDED